MRSLLVPFAIGFVGMLLGLLLVHGYNDHVAVHALVNVINAAQQRQASGPQQ